MSEDTVELTPAGWQALLAQARHERDEAKAEAARLNLALDEARKRSLALLARNGALRTELMGLLQKQEEDA